LSRIDGARGGVGAEAGAARISRAPPTTARQARDVGEHRRGSGYAMALTVATKVIDGTSSHRRARARRLSRPER
jgi:hypothetical protein